MICKQPTELPSQMLTNRLCCVLSYAPSLLYWQRKNIPTNTNSRATIVSSPLFYLWYCCYSIFSPILYDVFMLAR